MGTEIDSGKGSKTLRVNRRSGILNKIKQWSKIGSAISGALVAVIAPLWLAWSSVDDKAQAAKKGAKSGYDTLAPAVTELQEDMQDGMEAVAEIAERLGKLTESHDQDHVESHRFEQRLIRCETYIELISRGRYKPVSEPIHAPPADAVKHIAKKAVRLLENKSRYTAEKIVKKRSRPVPQSFKQAKSYQQQRTVLRCSPKDPLCGVK